MCTSFRQGGKIISPGRTAGFMDYFRQRRNGMFGAVGWTNPVPNVRDDKLESYWYQQGLMRGIVYLDTFFDRGHEFGLDKLGIAVACLYGESGFALVTTESSGIVKEIHHRMPAVILDEGQWLYNGEFSHFEGLKMIA